MLGDGDGYLGDVGLLVAVDDPQIGRGLQVRAAAARAFGKPVLVYVGFPPELEMRPRRTGLLAAFTAFTSRFGFTGGGVLPGASSPDGGIEELRLLRDCRCSSLANFAVSVALAAVSSWIRVACSPSSAAIATTGWRTISGGVNTR